MGLYVEIFRRVGRKTDFPPMDLILLFYNLTAEVGCRSITIGQYWVSDPDALRKFLN